VVEENQRARLFLELARTQGGFEEMGELMYQSHYGYSECGLGCEAADYLVSLVWRGGSCRWTIRRQDYRRRRRRRGCGARETRCREDAFYRILKRYVQFHGEAPQILEGSSVGADRFGVLTLGA